MKQFRKLQITDDVLNRIQDNISDVFTDIIRRLILNGVFLQDVSIFAGKDNLINHGLQRKPLMFFTTPPDVDSRVWHGVTSQPELYVNLQCSADCTVSLWVA